MSSVDPIRERRLWVARLATLGQRVGYGLLALATVLFVVALVTDLPGGLVAAVIACLVVGSAVLAPAIVLGFAAKAAEREDREAGR
jgi:sugar phosphate permease